MFRPSTFWEHGLRKHGKALNIFEDQNINEDQSAKTMVGFFILRRVLEQKLYLLNVFAPTPNRYKTSASLQSGRSRPECEEKA